MPETGSLLVWLLVAMLAAGAVGGVLAVRKERKVPTSFTRGAGDLAWWGLLSAEEQEEADTAALDAGEQADSEARRDAAEAAEFLASRAQFNALYHP